MCGIVGYIGNLDARSIILEGLKKLEYRGYDSSGIALKCNNDFKIFKDKGRIAHLCEITDYSFSTNMGIAHTRWATHGMVNYENSHPHISNNKRFILVHNGIIENYRKIKIDYLADYSFYSETDSEVIVNFSLTSLLNTYKDTENVKFYLDSGKEETKIKIRGLIKLKSFCTAKETTDKMKRQPT